MRIADFIVAAVVVAGLSGTAHAQTPSAPPAPTNPPVYTYDPTDDHWIASAYIGSNFGSGRGTQFDTTDSTTSLNFGGQLGYLWNGVGGVEVLTDFSPSFEINSLLLADNPDINTYMANGIVAVPIGDHRQFLPYFSGGIGAVQMLATFFTLNPTGVGTTSALDTVKGDETRFGGDVGGGAMGYAGHIGFRGDIRYFKTSVDNNPTAATPEGQVTQAVLSGLAFWRANIGVAFRW
jgi:outer membrane protein with beta-barrel domain